MAAPPVICVAGGLVALCGTQEKEIHGPHAAPGKEPRTGLRLPESRSDHQAAFAALRPDPVSLSARSLLPISVDSPETHACQPFKSRKHKALTPASSWPRSPL